MSSSYNSLIEQRNRLISSYETYPGCRLWRVLNRAANNTLSMVENYLDPDGPIFIDDALLRAIIVDGAIGYVKAYHNAYHASMMA